MSLLYKKEDKIVTITFNRKEALNSFNPQQYIEFSDALNKFNDDPEAWVAIITGSGNKSFSAGADLKELVPQIQSGEFKPPSSIVRGQNIYKPIIAAVNGIAFGGGLEVAIACDIRIASENAIFGVPEVKWGLIPGWGGTQRLSRMLPVGKASELLLMGNSIDAKEALSFGLINKLVPASELMSCSLKWAKQICENAPLAVRAAKEAMLRGLDLNIDDGLAIEQSLVDSLLTTEDEKEGLKAFSEKRKPVYKCK